MTARRPGDLIALAPRPPAESLSLRLHLRPGHPPAYVATDPFEWWWLAPITIESFAPMPTRDFRHVARILALPALGESATQRRN